jgi:hypothetical protein
MQVARPVRPQAWILDDFPLPIRSRARSSRRNSFCSAKFCRIHAFLRQLVGDHQLLLQNNAQETLVASESSFRLTTFVNSYKTSFTAL